MSTGTVECTHAGTHARVHRRRPNGKVDNVSSNEEGATLEALGSPTGCGDGGAARQQEDDGVQQQWMAVVAGDGPGGGPTTI
jgi:hypothetical protein